MYHTFMDSPLGLLTLFSDGQAITAITMPVWRYVPPPGSRENLELPVFHSAKRCLENYFTDTDMLELPPLSPVGTPFQQQVWQILSEIPRGTAVTYGDIARKLEKINGSPASPRAVGGAVGRNPIAILIPCHRVLGAGGRITGFGGGLDAKRFLLELEGIPYRD